ncbi:MAG: hypothetical protein GXY27_02695 [Erysipelotrichaceae bacterium]|jgi:hypothetical protein|nr:hypothetical protein [Erysipelotrichaceae bacterium]
MKNKHFSLLIPALMIVSLVGCNPVNNKAYNEFVARAADSVSLLLNSNTGKEIYPSETIERQLDNYNSVLALKQFTFQEKEITLDWEYSPVNKWVVGVYTSDESRLKMTPIYGPEAFEASIKCNVSYVEKGKTLGKVELNWKFNVDVTVVTEMTLQAINETYVNNNFKLDGLAGKDENDNTIIIGTRGYITATFEQPDHLYAGVFLSDGAYSMQLYAGKLSNLWNEGKYKVGDCIFVVGTISLYSGLMEIAPTFMEVINGEAYNIASPVTLDGNDIAWNTSSAVYASTLVTLDDCTYKSGNVDKVSSHANIIFMHGSDEIVVACNYHIGPTFMQNIKDLVGGKEATESEPAVPGFVANQTKVNLRGILSIYDSTLQIIPVFGADSITVVE